MAGTGSNGGSIAVMPLMLNILDIEYGFNAGDV
jgi:hypothetical protein